MIARQTIYITGDTMDVASLQTLNRTATLDNVTSSAGLHPSADTTCILPNNTKDTFTSTLIDIASRYDVRHISPQQIPELGKELYEKGLISGSEALGMSLLPHLINSGDVGLTTGSDGTVDLLEHWRSVASMQQTSKAATEAQQAVNVLQSLTQYPHEKSSFSKPIINVQRAVDVSGAASSYMNAISKTTTNAQRIVNVLEALSTHLQDTSNSSKS